MEQKEATLEKNVERLYGAAKSKIREQEERLRELRVTTRPSASDRHD